MKRFIVLSLLLLSFSTLFAQSRPKIEVNGQKANKRPPQTIENKPKPEPPTTNEPEPDATPPAADFAETIQDGEVLRIDTNLVTIPVKVSDKRGRFISGLTKESFKVFEDGAEQEIAYFSNSEEPFTVALVLDMSYSAAFKIDEIQAAAMAFVNQLHPKDKVMIVSFDEEINVVCELTSDRRILQSAIKTTKIGYGTSLYETVDFVVNQRLKKISGRKAIILFTDGVDTTSRTAYAADNLRDVYETDSLIYPVEYDTFSDVQAMKNKPVIAKQPSPFPIPGTGTPSPFPFPIPTVGTPGGTGTTGEDYRKADEYLQELANSTNGRVYKADTTVNLATAFTNIASELRQIYSLGFYPTEEKAGKRRQLKVRVNQTGTVVQARDSYVVGKKVKRQK
jgi:VWFA-related protein